MSVDLLRSIVRILKPDGSTAGTGFVVSEDGLVATCAHVVQLAGAKPGGVVRLVFYRTNTEASANVDLDWWSDPDKADISFLRVNGELPSVLSLPLGSSEGTSGHPFKSFGFPEVAPERGLFGYGTVGDRKPDADGFDILQLTGTSEVTQGFSGGPVVDIRHRRVIGMVSAVTTRDRLGKVGETALITPTETLRAICPKLQLTDICPYLSLEAFTEEDAELFFGRRRVVNRLLARLKSNPRFLAVLGPSGSGKSSLVRAGLIPALRKGMLPGSEHWGVIVSRPANQPFEQLAAQGLLGATDMRESVRWWLAQHKEQTRLVLVIDQFEELLVSCEDSIRSSFLQQLTFLLNSRLPPVLVLLVMRDDFYSNLAQVAPLLLPWIEKGLANIVTTLEEEDLSLIITEPARVVGLEIEAGLEKIIIDDVIKTAPPPQNEIRTARVTVLPLLEFALTQLWEKRQEQVLTLDAYTTLSGLTGALTQWADQAYYTLEESERPLARRIFTDLVHLGNDSQGIPDSRIRKPLHELWRTEEEKVAGHQIVWHLADARLLVTARDEQSGQETVEIIHDALIREWGELQQWIKEDRRFLLWKQQVEDQAAEWHRLGQTGGWLDEIELAEADQWLASADAMQLGCSPSITDFIDASRKTIAEEKERELRIQEERLAAIALMRDQHVLASVARAYQILYIDPLKAIDEAREALTMKRTLEGEQVLRIAMEVGLQRRESRRDEREVLGSGVGYLMERWRRSNVFTRLRNDGRYALVASERGKDGPEPPGNVYMISLDNLRTVELQPGEKARGRRLEYMGFSTSGAEIFVARQFYLDVYDLEGNRVNSVQLEYHAKPTHLIAGMFGSYVLVGDTVGHLMLADTLSDDRPQLMGGRYPDAALFIESDVEGTRAIVIFESGRAQLVIIDDPSSPAEYELGPEGTIHAAFSPRPHMDRFLTASQTGQIEVWQFADGSLAKRVSFNHGETPVGLVSFSSDGTRVISLGDDSVYKVWDISKHKLVVSYSSRN